MVFNFRVCYATYSDGVTLTVKSAGNLKEQLEKWENEEDLHNMRIVIEAPMNISKILEEYRNVHHIYHIIFDDKPFLFLDRSIDNYPILEGQFSIFDCNNCSVKEIQEQTFSKMTKLIVVNLNKNQIEEVHKNAFSKNSKIENISLSENMLTEVPELNELIHFKKFNLSLNVHLTIKNDQPILKQPNLKIFLLNKCNISKIFALSFSGLPNLEELYLNGNKIKSIEDSAFSKNPKLIKLSLFSNPTIKISCYTVSNITDIQIEKPFCEKEEGTAISDSDNTDSYRSTPVPPVISSTRVTSSTATPNPPTIESINIEESNTITKNSTTPTASTKKYLIFYQATLIVIQILLIVAAYLYLKKIQSEDVDDDLFDYSATIENINYIYKINK